MKLVTAAFMYTPVKAIGAILKMKEHNFTINKPLSSNFHKIFDRKIKKVFRVVSELRETYRDLQRPANAKYSSCYENSQYISMPI